MDDEEVHIAVGKNLRKEKANILWAAANFPRATIVLVHVHWPSKWMPFSKIYIYILLQSNLSYPSYSSLTVSHVLAIRCAHLLLRVIWIGCTKTTDKIEHRYYRHE
jgi:hypothetical protein